MNTNNTVDKTYISAQSLLEDSFRLGYQILASGFTPAMIAGVWRGGTPIGIAVQEILDYHGVKADHIAIRTSSYHGMEQQKIVRVHGLEYLIENLNAEDSLLLVDDVFDSGRSLKAIIAELQRRCRRNLPEVIRIATVYYKPQRNTTDLAPDYFLRVTDDWLVFPHEIHGLRPAEILERKGLNLAALEASAGRPTVR